MGTIPEDASKEAMDYEPLPVVTDNSTPHSLSVPQSAIAGMIWWKSKTHLTAQWGWTQNCAVVTLDTSGGTFCSLAGDCAELVHWLS